MNKLTLKEKVEKIELQIQEHLGLKDKPWFCMLHAISLSSRTSGAARICCSCSGASVFEEHDTGKKNGGTTGYSKDKDGNILNLGNISLLDAFNSESFKRTRIDAMNGKVPKSCVKCYKEEMSGHNSKRIWETVHWVEHRGFDPLYYARKIKNDGTVPDTHLKYLDMRFGNTCSPPIEGQTTGHMACRMCSPHDSAGTIPSHLNVLKKLESSEYDNPELEKILVWDKKDKAMANYNWHKDESVVNDIIEHAKSGVLKQLYLAGGEPLYIKASNDLVKELAILKQPSSEDPVSKNILLRYNTNAVHLPEDVVEAWKSYKKVKIHFSVDSLGKKNDYIRQGSLWSHTLESMKKLNEIAKSMENVEITFAATVMLYNIFDIVDMFQWKLENNGSFLSHINKWPAGAGMVNCHFLMMPQMLSVLSLPENLKIKATEKINNYIEYLKTSDAWKMSGAPSKEEFLANEYGVKRLEGIINFMNSEDHSYNLKATQDYTQIQDEYFGTNFVELFPELESIMTTNWDSKIIQRRAKIKAKKNFPEFKIKIQN